MIRVVDDLYGYAPENRCTHHPDDCVIHSAGQRSIVSQICSSKSSCRDLIITRQHCNDRVTSYQQITYECVPSKLLKLILWKHSPCKQILIYINLVPLNTISLLSVRSLLSVCQRLAVRLMSGYLSSPNFPEMYPRNQSCSCVLQAQDGKVLSGPCLPTSCKCLLP